MGRQSYFTYFSFTQRMGAKTQIENKKLNVPAPGAYNIPDRVSAIRRKQTYLT